MPVGFLIVYSEPGELVTLEEFQDWYNNEHVPLRMKHLQSFLAGARYFALDSQIPSWVALYDVDDTATFSHNSYVRLRANRSPREANLVKRLSILDRQTCELVMDSGASILTTSLASKNPSRGIITHGLGMHEEESREWLGKAVELLKNSQGWARTRLFKCIDNLKTGVSVPSGPEVQIVPVFFVVHEFTTSEIASDPTTATNILSISTITPLSELRKWGLYRAYPGIAQGNL
ncbi:hypothetical protein DFH05DRAFT_1529181 [Lentinula detonsa]|uniref:EthD domain-containing protein n=1 Tax=Lentinula detonsa TaxID=2804962 RepID=A0A9W8NTQ8_9AGAR|nr:hypothetical protein DFH05DRAFT_1529181 [Lentinula detonsa]KAJ3982989.1 hypothetical protein F5890DRAFT_267264 [Lentinula detonsa]